MDVKLPKLGESSDSGVVVTLFVKEGDTVQKDQSILELENEKAVAAIPAPVSGIVGRVFVKVGDKVAVGHRLMSIGDGEPAAASAPAAAPAESEPSATTSAARVPAASNPAAAQSQPLPAAAQQPMVLEDVSDQPMPSASPTIRRLAAELGIDLRRIRGSERGGRVVMGDLKAYIQRLERSVAQSQQAVGRTLVKPEAEPVDFSKWGPVTVKPLSPLRQVISRRMGESWASVPRVTQFDEADVTLVTDLRKKHAAAFEARGAKLTLTVFAIKALVGILQKYPIFNSSLDSTGQNLVMKSYFNIGIAVDTEAGLMVPVIKDADKKTMAEIARELEDAAKKTRDRKIASDDLKGGTFTVSNQGGIGSAHFTPIVNLPEVAILGIGRGAVKPVWRDESFVPRTLLPLALSYDHRVIDGGTAARFMVELVKAFESFDEAWLRL